MSARTPFETLIDPSAELECIGSGFVFTEGPAWNAAEQRLYFSDILGDACWRWSEQDGMELVRRPNFKGNGMVFDAHGNRLVCEHVTSCVTRFRPTDERDVLAFHYRGTYLNSPNDLVVRAADGSVYFTDPDYGRWNDEVGVERSRPLGFRGLYRIPADGAEIELLVPGDELDQPNGLCFSPDESILYVNDTPRAHIKAWDVRPDGTLEKGRTLLDGVGTGTVSEGIVDGMECDELGNVWVTGPGGVWVVSAEGERLGVIETPEPATSLAWGGDDLRSLFLTTTTTVHVMRTLVASAALPGHRLESRSEAAGT